MPDEVHLGVSYNDHHMFAPRGFQYTENASGHITLVYYTYH